MKEPIIGIIIRALLKGANSPTNPKTIPPTVNDPKEILYHQVKTLKL